MESNVVTTSRLGKVSALLVMSLVFLGLIGGSSAAAPTTIGGTYFAGYLDAGATRQVCRSWFDLNDYGPIVASGLASNYGIVITVKSTQVQFLGDGYLRYCATLTNASSRGSDVYLTLRAQLSSAHVLATPLPGLAPGARGLYCFSFNYKSMTGPVAVSATPKYAGAELATVRVDLEHRQGYGWVYCASILNSSAVDSGSFTLRAKSGLTSSNSFNYYAGYLSAGATQRYCFNYPPAATPASVIGAAVEYNARIATLSVDRENRFNYGYVYCATIRNLSSIGTGVNLQTQAGL